MLFSDTNRETKDAFFTFQSLNTYHVDVRYEEHTVQPTIDRIDGYFKTMQQRRCLFVVCVMHTRTEEERNQLKLNIKDCGTIKYGECFRILHHSINHALSLIILFFLGIMTQCADLNKIAANRSVTSYCDNLIRKINFKNAGINTKVDLDVALKNKKSKKDAWMFFGADVIHPTNVTRQHPSIAGMYLCEIQHRTDHSSFSSYSSRRRFRRFVMFNVCSTCLSTISKTRQMFDRNDRWINGNGQRLVGLLSTSE